jgi:adenylosuccinate synthase
MERKGMSVTAIVGANWGDEGKGKITDYLAGQSDFVVRFQGGKNAGHTIINEYGKFALHLLPSGVFFQNVINILGTGVAVDIAAFVKERDELIKRGIPAPKVIISDRAQVVMPYHMLFDQYEEERLADKSFGSTKSGIAPFYADKYSKIGIQTSELFDKDLLFNRLSIALAPKNVLLKHLYNKPEIKVEEMVEWLLEQGKLIKPYLCDTAALLHQALKEGKMILLEGQLGALRDPDHGIYPYPTSSSTLAGFAAIGAGLPPHTIRRVIAVTKAYSSCVGAGPFVSEIFGEAAGNLRERGGDAGEYGATTGRPRRMGWFDVVATRYGCRIQGATEVTLSLLDVLGYLEEIPVCVGYEINGQKYVDFPVPALLDKAKPILEKLPGWRSKISSIRNFEDLPKEARDYVLFIEQQIQVPVKIISVGPSRTDIIIRNYH